MDALKANWPASNNVHALTTTRWGGVSTSPYESNNLAHHVGDNDDDVQRNREHLFQAQHLPSHPEWLEQTHTNHCVVIEDDLNRQADAALTRKPNTVLAILTADCMPIVISNLEGSEIAAIHAGWRGLANGIIENTLNRMRSPNETLMAWIGPTISQARYETGEEVRETFIQQYDFTSAAFQSKNDRLYAALPTIAELIFHHHQVPYVYQSHQCTYDTKNTNQNEYQYYSYRREKQTGRIATLIWFS